MGDGWIWSLRRRKDGTYHKEKEGKFRAK